MFEMSIILGLVSPPRTKPQVVFLCAKMIFGEFAHGSGMLLLARIGTPSCCCHCYCCSLRLTKVAT